MSLKSGLGHKELSKNLTLVVNIKKLEDEMSHKKKFLLLFFPLIFLFGTGSHVAQADLKLTK